MQYATCQRRNPSTIRVHIFSEGPLMRNINPIKRPSTLNELAYEEIKKLLITGQLEFNTTYSANQFAEILGVSRTPVREALLQLAKEGCLIPVQGQGFRIKDYSEKEIKDFIETRKMIESYVLERLVGTLTREDIAALEDSLKRMMDKAKKGGDTNGFLEADKDFHMKLVHRYNNFFLVSVMQNIRNLISILGGKALARRERVQEVISEHEIILQAVREKKRKKAVEALAYHLSTTEKYLLENSQEG
jgi:DNA-binding GntR family transcriptional regulator